VAFKSNTQPIEGETFDHFRTKSKQINSAIHLLVKYNYKVIDMENNWIGKDNIEKLDIPL
jgi:hypothetical protein